MEELLSVKEDFETYSVIPDIRYSNIDCRGQKLQKNLKHKYLTDLYLPKVNNRFITSKSDEEQANRKPPIVVFVHGGGWRRGDKHLWKHFTSDDINFLAAFMVWFFGLYKSIGISFASRGVPCVVMSYPLTRLRSIWLLLELFVSYACSVIFLGGFLGTGFILLSAIQISILIGPLRRTMYLYPDFSWSNVLDLLALHLLTSNLLIFMTISLQYNKYNHLNFLRVIILWTVIVATHPVSVHYLPSGYVFICFFLITFSIPQGIIVINNLTCEQSLPKDQCKTLAMCIKKVQGIGEQSGLFDTRSIFLIGHSSGGHICALTALDDFYLQNENIPISHIKGVITLSGVLHIEHVRSIVLNQLYLYPPFGKNTQCWESLSPLYTLRSKSQHVPNFLVVTAAQDFVFAQQAKSFIEELKSCNKFTWKIIIPQSNHVSVVRCFDRCKTSPYKKLADICVDFIFTATKEDDLKNNTE